jgi:hypothetical protein
MRIEGLSQPPRTPQTSQRNDAAGGKKDGGRAGDVVEISQNTQEVADLSAAAKAAPDELNPRIQEIRGRVESGFYNSREVQEQIADAMLESDGLQEVVADISQAQVAKQKLEQVPDTRPEEVDKARQRVGTGFYDSAQVRQDTAERVLDELA